MNRIKRIQFSNCVTWNGKLYGFLDNTGYPIEIDLQTREARLICSDSLPEESIQADLLLCDNKIIYILELNGKRLIQYNTESKAFECFYINYNGSSWGNFVFLTKLNRYIYIFTKKADCIILIDLQSKKVTKRDVIISDKESIQFSSAFRKGNRICLFSQNGKGLWIYNLESEKFEEHKEMYLEECPVTVVCFESNGYVLGEKGGIYRCSFLDYSIKEIRKCKKGALSYIWGNIAVTKRNIWMLPSLGEDICIIEEDNLKEEILTGYPDNFSYIPSKDTSKFYGYGEDDSYYYFAERLANYMLKIDKNSGRGEWVKLCNPLKKDWADVVSKYAIYEQNSNEFILHNFLELICSGTNVECTVKCENIGQCIYEMI